MKRIIATALLLASTSVALAQAPENRWRSPFTPAPVSGLSPLDMEKNHKVMEAECAAWAARRAKPTLANRSTSIAPVSTAARTVSARKKSGGE